MTLPREEFINLICMLQSNDESDVDLAEGIIQTYFHKWDKWEVLMFLKFSSGSHGGWKGYGMYPKLMYLHFKHNSYNTIITDTQFLNDIFIGFDYDKLILYYNEIINLI